MAKEYRDEKGITEKLISEGGELGKIPYSRGGMCVKKSGNIVAKTCSKCKAMKYVEEYSKDSGSKTGIRSHCRDCASTDFGKWYEDNAEYARDRAREYAATHPDKVRRTKEKYYENNRDKILKRYEEWRVNNKQRRAYSESLRSARKRILPKTITEEQREYTLKTFGYSCALTGERNDIHMDHVIPINTGHEGTVYGNVVPLTGRLNLSKRDRNLFEWYEESKDKYNIPQIKFDEMVNFLATAKGMTVEGYREYVYWCHENPVDLLTEQEGSERSG